MSIDSIDLYNDYEEPPARPRAPVVHIGVIVHYVHEGKHCAALITDDADEGGAMGLTVFPVDAAPFSARAWYDAGFSAGSWHCIADDGA